MSFQGTTRTDPCKRNYRTRLLPWMSGVETHVRVRMQREIEGQHTYCGNPWG
jgi:hypothetical protein